MPQVSELTDQEVQALAETVLRRELAQVGFDHVETRAARDHDGDPSLFVVAVMRSDVDLLPAKTFNRAHQALDEVFLSKGERRLPYFAVRWDGEAPGEDVESGQGS